MGFGNERVNKFLASKASSTQACDAKDTDHSKGVGGHGELKD